MLALFLAWAPPASAQEELEDAFKGFGTATTEDAEKPPPGQRPGEGAVTGRIFDGETGQPVAGATVIVTWPKPADGSQPKLEVQMTRADGSFEFPSVPSGSYSISFSKAGYRASTMTDFRVEAGVLNRADFPLPPLPPQTSDEVLQLDAFVVEAATVGEMMDALELRMDSDLQLNIMSAEDFSKFASSDVADALKRVAGVNVVEGEFAIIRGLEDRYSSTLYNSAVVPSPDPNRQSVQLDLFPTEVVSNLVVAKTFAPELPGNSSGGSIDIVTHEYPPEGFTFKIKGALGFNQNALDRFLEFDPGQPVATESESGLDVLGPEAGVFFGGRGEFRGREIRYKAVFNWELDFATAEGFQESREPRRAEYIGEGRFNERVIRSGDLAFGEANLSSGLFDLTTSERSEQTTYYGGFGFDFDEAGNHRLDASVFYTKKDQEIAQLKENGFLPNFDYSAVDPNLSADFRCCAPDGTFITKVRDTPRDSAARNGPVWFASFLDSRSFGRERDLLVTQANGQHRIEQLRGLDLRWAFNYATTTQSDASQRLQYVYEPLCVTGQPESPLPPDCGPTQIPVTVASLGEGLWAANATGAWQVNDVDESQFFGRVDAEYDVSVSETLALRFTTGGWFETVDRSVVAQGFRTPRGEVYPQRETPQELGAFFFGGGFGAESLPTLNDSTRDVWAWSIGSKATLWGMFDLIGGVRLENNNIQSNNDPFTGIVDVAGVAQINPSRFLFFDRRDNPTRPLEAPTAPAFTVFNDQILRIDVPVDDTTTACHKLDFRTFQTDERGCVDIDDEAQLALINGEIDDRQWLPAVGFAVRPLEGMSLKGSWSRTVARPSFREMGYYLSFEPGADEPTIGNPQLQLSEVESWDLRGEYVWGSYGDLVAVSGFYKNIDDPIETILVRNPADFTRSGGLYRTFFNNPNSGRLWGIEFEARKNLGFIPKAPFLEYFSIGGNFTYINGKVDRSETEISRSDAFFDTCPATDFLCQRSDEGASFPGLGGSRRLFGQPEWIVNADVSFDQPDWGTKATLAFFAISDVLQTAGGATFLSPGGFTFGYGLDRYVDSFHTLDLILSQSWSPEFMPGVWTFKFRIKNLTDSRRGIVYDPDATVEKIYERRFRVGRDYKFSISYSF